MKGSELPFPVDETILLFSKCQAFEFRHLPEAGGLFDQNPMLMDRFLYILNAQEEHRKKEEAEKKRREGGPSGRKIRGSRPAH